MRPTVLLVCLSGIVTSMGLDPDSGRQRYAKRIVGDPLP